MDCAVSTLVLFASAPLSLSLCILIVHMVRRGLKATMRMRKRPLRAYIAIEL